MILLYEVFIFMDAQIWEGEVEETGAGICLSSMKCDDIERTTFSRLRTDLEL
jgi:hypothetical protein